MGNFGWVVKRWLRTSLDVILLEVILSEAKDLPVPEREPSVGRMKILHLPS
jgi:hypothetical protein